VATSLLEHLPDEGDPERPMEEKIAQNVLFAVYAGTCGVNNVGPLTDFFVTALSGGADSVSKTH
jgi:hypothetical protein